MSATTKKTEKTDKVAPDQAIATQDPASQPTPVAVRPGLAAPDFLSGGDLDEFAGAGTSDRREDSVLPFLAILQKGSPQVNEKKSDYVPGAKPGMLYNTATRTLYPAEGDGVGPLAIQGFMEMAEVEWIPRSAGGGFVAKHPLDTPLVNQITEVDSPDNPGSNRKLRMLQNGHQLVTTAYHYLILPDTLEPCAVALTSSGLKTHREWNFMLRNKRLRNEAGQIVIAPSFATLCRLQTVWREQDGFDWYTLKVTDLGWVRDAESYEETKRMHMVARSEGLRTAAPPSGEGDRAEVHTGRTIDAEAQRVMDEEIPF